MNARQLIAFVCVLIALGAAVFCCARSVVKPSAHADQVTAILSEE